MIHRMKSEVYNESDTEPDGGIEPQDVFVLVGSILSAIAGVLVVYFL